MYMYVNMCYIFIYLYVVRLRAGQRNAISFLNMTIGPGKLVLKRCISEANLKAMVSALFCWIVNWDATNWTKMTSLKWQTWSSSERLTWSSS